MLSGSSSTEVMSYWLLACACISAKWSRACGRNQLSRRKTTLVLSSIRTLRYKSWRWETTSWLGLSWLDNRKKHENNFSDKRSFIKKSWDIITWLDVLRADHLFPCCNSSFMELEATNSGQTVSEVRRMDINKILKEKNSYVTTSSWLQLL